MSCVYFQIHRTPLCNNPFNIVLDLLNYQHKAPILPANASSFIPADAILSIYQFQRIYFHQKERKMLKHCFRIYLCITFSFISINGWIMVKIMKIHSQPISCVYNTLTNCCFPIYKQFIVITFRTHGCTILHDICIYNEHVCVYVSVRP